jgi:hypothetical protein
MSIELVVDDNGRSLPYFLERVAAAMAPEVLVSVEHIDGQFRLEINELPSFDYYVDPLVELTAAELDQDLSTDTIRFWLKGGDDWQISMNDAWTLCAWDNWLDLSDERPIVLLHADDHDDLMAPRLHIRPDGWFDAITGQDVAFGNGSMTAAVRSSAIGMGSFLTVMTHHPRVTELRHLRGRPHRYDDLGWLRRTDLPDPLQPDRTRLAVEPTSVSSDVRFSRVEQVDDWVRGLDHECAVLVHVDLDFLSNRYDCDSDWMARADLFDPASCEVQERLCATLEAIDSLSDRVVGAAFAISPGFFPAEHWLDAVALIETWARS